jgi:hypothetical protein
VTRGPLPIRYQCGWIPLLAIVVLGNILGKALAAVKALFRSKEIQRYEKELLRSLEPGDTGSQRLCIAFVLITLRYMSRLGILLPTRLLDMSMKFPPFLSMEQYTPFSSSISVSSAIRYELKTNHGNPGFQVTHDHSKLEPLPLLFYTVNITKRQSCMLAWILDSQT